MFWLRMEPNVCCSPWYSLDAIDGSLYEGRARAPISLQRRRRQPPAPAGSVPSSCSVSTLFSLPTLDANGESRSISAASTSVASRRDGCTLDWCAGAAERGRFGASSVVASSLSASSAPAPNAGSFEDASSALARKARSRSCSALAAKASRALAKASRALATAAEGGGALASSAPAAAKARARGVISTALAAWAMPCEGGGALDAAE